ncbi:MAG: cation:proton antiporter, partial [Prevotella sp.]|nr:cation:proton antiporter [Prevotella sp.]
MLTILSYLPITDATWIFFTVLCIILFAPMLMSKLKIPHIIGMVLAGVIVGPYGLNILERDASFGLFGQVGLYYIMFLAGLEMDMEGLKKNYHRMVFFGLLTFLIPFLLVDLFGGYLMNYSRQALILLSCVMASNTLIAYPIVCKYGLQRHRSVTLSVGASMMALLLALLVSSGLSSVMHDSGRSIFVIILLLIVKLIVYCAAMAYLVPRVTRWFLQHYSDAVTQFIFALGVLFLNAAITSLMGIEGVFGAFFAGLLLNRYIPRVSPLMSRIEFTGNALFIPYFLIGVGML